MVYAGMPCVRVAVLAQVARLLQADPAPTRSEVLARRLDPPRAPRCSRVKGLASRVALEAAASQRDVRDG